ncbi:methyl-accepting chemotaxis protein [Desulfocurvibacter africanus]|uniref:methyl-accepting chemotaxis protein n=1 Tax=Desulfocurvibacter africanus TaxID=873 RepID=UPI00048758AD|nr:methyl-accepting chemotaxis protein [Desulfocurvibacter africanus]
MKIRFAAMFALIIISSIILAFLSIGQTPMLILSLFIIGVASSCAICAFRQFVRPLQIIVAYARQIADGNLTGSIEGKFILELNELAFALQKVANTLSNKLAFMTSMLDNIPTPMAFISPNGKITWLNKPMVDLIDAGGSPESHYGEDFSVFFYGERRETVTEKAIRTRERHSAKGEVTSRKGIKKWISVASSPIFDPNGVLIGGFTSVFDFTRVVEKEQGMTRMNQQIMEAVRTFEEISKELSLTGVSLGEDIAGVNKGMDEQKDRVNETVTAMEQMNATVLEVARNASEAAGNSAKAKDQAFEGEEVVKQVVASIQAVQAQAMNLKESMSALGKQSESIGAILEVISDIADQTNLLALNAAIEAARAGDAGRGFAVVADEVRKLAEKTMNATKEVGQAISGIQQGTRENMHSVDKAVQAIEETTVHAKESGISLQAIVDYTETSSIQVQSIATAAEEQSSASEQINRAMVGIDHATEDTLAAMRRAVAHVEHLNGLAEKLTDSMHALASTS